MKKLIITDSSNFDEYLLFDYFYPSPLVCQTLNKQIFASILGKEIDLYTPQGLFETTINRYFLTDIKVMEHPLILKNIINHCTSQKINEVELLINRRNKPLIDFYKPALDSNGINTTINFHENPVFWKNSLTSADKVFSKKLKIAATITVQFAFLLLNRLFKKINWSGKKVLLWSSFANNREKIDYVFLDKLCTEKKDIDVIHPNPYLFKSKSNWNKSIYWMGEYSIPPGKFLKTVFRIFPFKKRFNEVLANYKDTLGYIPQDWNIDVLQKTYYFFIYNLLMGYLVEKASTKKDFKLINIYRGGSAAGLIYSGITKQRNQAVNNTNVLVPHGTEFNPIDHFSYFYLDYNILPSEKIKENWDKILNDQYSQQLKYSICENCAGGRIDYAYLQQKVNSQTRAVKTDNKYRIGIVLTYNSDSYQQAYIASIINLFSNNFTDELEFVVKPRPNLPYVPNEALSKDPRLIIDKGDIFPFLNSIDMVVGTVSVYGVLTMVVTDGILCDIPGFYYFPNKAFSKNDLGYSFHETMDPYCFSNETDLEKFIAQFGSFNEFINAVTKVNSQTKSYLIYPEDPYLYIENLINNSLN